MDVKSIDGYQIFMKKKIGEGAFGQVFIAQSNENKELYAAKIINKEEVNEDPYLKKALASQIKILRSVYCENCVRCIDVMESSKNYYVIQQLCDSDLRKELMKRKNHRLPEQQAIPILIQICNGFLTLVEGGIVHRDLKPQNILLKKGVIKICDFGFSKKMGASKRSTILNSIVGTPLYMPKQILQEKPYTSKCDIWGIGVLFYQILHGYTPWVGLSLQNLLYNIINNKLKIEVDLEPNTVDFLEKTLAIDENQRISWNELFSHPIFKGFFQKKMKKKIIIENNYKKLMSDIRFFVESENIDLERVWKSLGYKNTTTLQHKQFYEFIELICPYPLLAEEKYFEFMDKNKDGVISLQEVKEQFQKYQIPLKSQFHGLGCKKIDKQTQLHILNCFQKLYYILTKKKITLVQVFDAYDKDKKGVLSYDTFKKMIKKLDPSFEEKALDLVFNLIDTDKNHAIDFKALNAFYCKINGIPQKLYLKE